MPISSTATSRPEHALSINLILAQRAHLDDAKIGIGKMIFQPGSGDEGRRSHWKRSLREISESIGVAIVSRNRLLLPDRVVAL